ncbi:unnamed protein product [Boreogadus saida]
MESLLGKLHRSTAMQARLANTAAILTLYTHHLSGLMQNQPVDASLAREFQSATKLSGFGVQGAGSGIRLLVGSALGGLLPAATGTESPSLCRGGVRVPQKSGEAGKALRSACTSGGVSVSSSGLVPQTLAPSTPGAW